MGLLDELKKLTKPYDDEDYLEEDLAEPVRAPGRAADARSYASYAEAPRSAEPVQPTRRPYVFSNQRAARQQQAADPYAQQDYGYAQQGYAQQGYAPDPYARSGYAPDPYAQQGYAAPARPQSGGAQPKLLLVHPDRFEQAADIADRIAVFYAGTTVETAPAADFRQGPEALRHPYSKALWRALPQHEFRPIPGFQPYAGNLPSGCLFAPRCPCRTAECEKSVPPMQTVRKGEVRCFHAT